MNLSFHVIIQIFFVIKISYVTGYKIRNTQNYYHFNKINQWTNHDFKHSKHQNFVPVWMKKDVYREIEYDSDSNDDDDDDDEGRNIYKSFKSVTFVSSNSYKIKEVKLILGEDFPWQVHCEALDLTEPQANAIEISIAKCKQAIELCDGPVIVEDTSLCFNALSGLPGPYIKWFYESIGNSGLAKLLDGFDDKSAYAQCVVSFTLGKGYDIKTFVGSTDGTIVRPTGPQGFGWDPIFRPLGSDKTFAEMERSEKNKISHRFKAFREFKAYINSRTDL